MNYRIQRRRVKSLFELNRKWQRFIQCQRIWKHRRNDITLEGSLNPPMIVITDDNNMIRTIYYVNNISHE